MRAEQLIRELAIKSTANTAERSKLRAEQDVKRARPEKLLAIPRLEAQDMCADCPMPWDKHGWVTPPADGPCLDWRDGVLDTRTHGCLADAQKHHHLAGGKPLVILVRAMVNALIRAPRPRCPHLALSRSPISQGLNLPPIDRRQAPAGDLPRSQDALAEELGNVADMTPEDGGGLRLSDPLRHNPRLPGAPQHSKPGAEHSVPGRSRPSKRAGLDTIPLVGHTGPQ
jgi:hypothetical protein